MGKLKHELLSFFFKKMLLLYDSHAKTIFSIDFPKIRLRYCSAGAHAGAPLRLYWRGFHAFVAADRCVVREDTDLGVFYLR